MKFIIKFRDVKKQISLEKQKNKFDQFKNETIKLK
jgi:hypothetical protein